MITKTLPFTLLFALTICSCDKEFNSEPMEKAIILDQFFFDSCYNYAPYNNVDEVKITDQSLYEHFADSVMKNPYASGCTTNQLPQIDFTNYFLIGKHTYISGGNVNTIRKILYNNHNKTITYKITTEILMISSARFYIMNWTLIPRKYINYKINYEVKYENI